MWLQGSWGSASCFMGKLFLRARGLVDLIFEALMMCPGTELRVPFAWSVVHSYGHRFLEVIVVMGAVFNL
jgi:cytosine/uracil/thiamine/allantoin permease